MLQEIGQKKAFAEQQLLIVKQQKAVKSRESRVLQLTSNELESLPKDTKVYEGVGKMYGHDHVILDFASVNTDQVRLHAYSRSTETTHFRGKRPQGRYG